MNAYVLRAIPYMTIESASTFLHLIFLTKIYIFLECHLFIYVLKAQYIQPYPSDILVWAYYLKPHDTILAVQSKTFFGKKYY